MMHGIMATAEGGSVSNLATAVGNVLEVAGVVFDFALAHPYLSFFIGASVIGVAAGVIHSLK